MKSNADRAYIYAKACGIVGKSFIGNRIRRLQDINRLSELDRLIFPQDFVELPEKELLVAFEKKVIARTTHQINLLLKTQQIVPRFIELIVRSYEYADVKLILSAIRDKEPQLPLHADLGRFGTVHYEKYPDIKGLFSGTDFEWLIKRYGESQSELLKLQIELDQHYYAMLWNELLKVSVKDTKYIREIIAEEIVLKNILWALRLSYYYHFEKKDIEPMLLNLSDGKHALSQAARDCLELPFDQFSAWAGFKYAFLINPEEPGTFWRLDVPHVQRKAALLLYRKARIYFRRSPFSLNTTACFIKLKQFEEDLLISLAEGVSLGLSGRDVLSMLEVSQ